MPEQKKEKLDFFKREEIKTMAKDLAFLRELEAQKQREKIASIKLKEDRLAQEKKLEQIPKQVKDKPKKIFSISEKPKIPSRSKKILVRGIIILLFVLFLGVIAWFFWPKEKPFIPESEQEIFEPIEQEVEEEEEEDDDEEEDEIEKQAINNQIGQLFIIGFEGKTVTPQLEEFFKKYKPGGVLLLSKNIENETQLKKLNSDLQALSLKESGVPLFIAVDQEGGIISRVDFLEEKTAQSEIETPEQALLIGERRGQALKELGINLNLAPLLDSIQEGDFLFERSFQKPIEEIGELGKALIQGQKTADILTAMKHFPGYGTISFHPEETLARVEQIPEISQFKKAMEANPELVMTSNVVYKEIDASLPFIFSPDGIQFLRNNLGINVLIISDDLDQNSLLSNFSLKEMVIKPIEAGVDIMIFSGWRSSVEQALETFLSALEIGEISETSVNNAVSRIINFKQDNL